MTIRLDSGETVIVPDSLLTGRADGSYFLALSLDELRGHTAPEGNAPLVIPVIHEEVEIAKRKVETGSGVRIRKFAREEEQLVDVPLIEEQVVVNRVPIGSPVDGPVPVRQEGDTIIVPVVEEVLVVQKQLRLVEELHIRRTRAETRRPQTIVLRKEEVTVERLEETRENPGESQGGTDDFRAVR